MRIIKSNSVPTINSIVGMHLVNVSEGNDLNGIYIVTGFTGTNTVLKISVDNDKYTKNEVEEKILAINNDIQTLIDSISIIDNDLSAKNIDLTNKGNQINNIINDLSAKGNQITNILNILASKASLQSINKEIADRIYNIKLLKDTLTSRIEYLQNQIDEINIDKYLDPQYVYNGIELILFGNEKLTVGDYVSYQESDYIRDIDTNFILDSKNNRITFNK